MSMFAWKRPISKLDNSTIYRSHITSLQIFLLFPIFVYKPMGATPTGPTLDPLNILVNKFNIATHVALILFLFSSWINYLLYDTKSVMVFWQLLSKIKRFVTIFRISWNGPTLFNIPIGDFPPLASLAHDGKIV